MKVVSFDPLPTHIRNMLACPLTTPHPHLCTSSWSSPAAVADIEIIVDQTVLSCPATGVSITVEFDVAVGSVGSSGAASTGATISSDNRYCFHTQSALTTYPIRQSKQKNCCAIEKYVTTLSDGRAQSSFCVLALLVSTLCSYLCGSGRGTTRDV